MCEDFEYSLYSIRQELSSEAELIPNLSNWTNISFFDNSSIFLIKITGSIFVEFFYTPNNLAVKGTYTIYYTKNIAIVKLFYRIRIKGVNYHLNILYFNKLQYYWYQEGFNERTSTFSFWWLHLRLIDDSQDENWWLTLETLYFLARCRSKISGRK